MKKQLLSVFALSMMTLAVVSCKNEASQAQDAVEITENAENADVYTANVEQSKINWTGSKVVGGQHQGTITLKSGDVAVADGAVQNGTFVIDFTTINVTDLEGDDKAYLEAHLKGTNQDDSVDHFFNVTEFPEGKFEIASVTTNGAETTITGNLTVKGITKSVSFPANVTVTDEVVTIETQSFPINRTDFNINYGSKSKFADLAADQVISDDILVQLNVVANK
ncbi:YceI family protein [Flavobacterium agricola]|uniref:YceI family protein n=1 Tax=Flavobacterium agricola TaxID=2870839 RepID=A0ABY6LVF7_9FLAO|nr:YceI family protein [Flavobacterium agricola]UYW00303.1 YceI family protein [Flavobacterium agricola]